MTLSRHIEKIFTEGMIVILISLLANCIMLLNISISTIISNSTTFLFMDKFRTYLVSIDNAYKGILGLNEITDKMILPSDLTRKLLASDAGYILSGVLSFAVFMILYRMVRKNSRFRLDHVVIFTQNETVIALFATLAFSVGIAFYFSADNMESEIRQSSILTIGDLNKTTQALKDSLLLTHISHQSLKYQDETFSEYFFFEIFIILIICLVIKTRSKFLSQALFFTSMYGLVTWIVLFATKLLSAPTPLIG